MNNPENLATQGTQYDDNTTRFGYHHMQTNTNVNNTWAAPNIVFMRKSERTSQHGTQNVKTH